MTQEIHYRTVRSDLELRSTGDKRTLYGIAVPWDVEGELDWQVMEVWRSGAFDHQLNAFSRVRFASGHVDLGGVLIGGTRKLRNDAKGLYGEWRVAKIPAGDEALELHREGVLGDLSIGFRERPNGTRVSRRPDGSYLLERVAADLFEVSLVTEGQYGRQGAMVAGLRERAAAGAELGDVADPTGAYIREGVRVIVDGREIDATPYESMITTPNLAAARAAVAELGALPALPGEPAS